jgi:outer membrane protein OmpA-like peptidoglycan-associated protein
VTVYSDGCPTDLDGDGVPDYLDKCPNTPKGTQVGPDGCELDSDADGVPDVRDRCPNTPKGVQVDVNGCPLDSDGDGVPDYLDKCPATPQGTRVNADGCSTTDSDGDGIPDDLDRCGNTPKGVAVGPDGCPLDSDNDGIPDYLDECPHSPPGAKVLPNGCALVGDCRKPHPGEQVDANGCAVEQNFILKGVKFEFDSDRLTPEAQRILDQVAITLQAYPNVNVEVEGHTDNIGSEAYNLGLSERRSIAVKKYLSEHAVSAGRMTPIGYGETRPIATNDTDEGREENRRVELHVVQ